jgi:hypothetical protein
LEKNGGTFLGSIKKFVGKGGSLIGGFEMIFRVPGSVCNGLAFQDQKS